VRHTDARRLAQSGTAKNDRHLTREGSKALRDHVRRNPQRANRRVEPILTTAHVDQHRPTRDQSPGGRGVDPQRRTAQCRRNMKATRKPTHQPQNKTANASTGVAVVYHPLGVPKDEMLRIRPSFLTLMWTTSPGRWRT
jgi:hypothetical protein